MENINVYDENLSDAPFLERISRYCLLILALLTPLFFLPPSFMPFLMGKTILLAFFTLIPAFTIIISAIKNKKIVFWKNPVVIAAIVLPIVMFIAALTGGNFNVSMWGRTFEVGSVGVVALMVILMLVAFTLLDNRDRIMRFYSAFFVGVALLILFHALRLIFGPDFFSLGFITAPAANLVGKWNDLGILFGGLATLSLIIFEFLPLSKILKTVVLVTGILSLGLIFVVNFVLIWYVLGFVALVTAVYKLFTKKTVVIALTDNDTVPTRKLKGMMPFASIIILVLAIISISDNRLNTPQSNNSMAARAADHFHIAQLEVRPSMVATLGIFKDMVAQKGSTAFFGSGPNRFVNAYITHKPQGVNETPFWNYDFDLGIGYIPSFLITTGVVGILAWLAFLLLFIYKGIKAIFARSESQLGRFLSFSAFMVAMYFWICTFFYTTGIVNIAYAFLFTGVALAVFKIEHEEEHEFHLAFAHRRIEIKGLAFGFLAVLLVLLLYISVTYVRIAIASAYFQNGLIVINTTGNIDEANDLIVKAVSWNKIDSYYQALTEINVVKMSRLVSSGSSEANIAEMQRLLSLAVDYSNLAVKYDETNYQNWAEKGRVLEAVVPFQVKDAYMGANDSYINAVSNNPNNPALYLMLARLELANKNRENAKKYIGLALQLKSNYAEAAFLLSQIQVDEGNVSDAIRSVQAAAQFSPNDPTIYFQLGLLEYNNKNYTGAIEALNRATAIDPQYSNARYFLGLSLSKIGRNEEAIKQFETVLQYNPNNQEVMLILKNLNAGKAPFADAKPPIDNKPEKRKTLPVKDDTRTKAPQTQTL